LVAIALFARDGSLSPLAAVSSVARALDDIVARVESQFQSDMMPALD